MTKTEIQTEIAEINAALSHLRKGGQSYSMMSAAGGGSQRIVTLVDYDKLVRHRNELEAQLRSLNEKRAFRIRSGW